MSSTLIFLVFSFFVACIALIIFGLWRDNAQKEAWRLAAGQVGLDYTPGGLFSPQRASGIYRDRHITIEQKTDQDIDDDTAYLTMATVRLKSECWKDVHLTRHGIVDTVTTFLGAEDKTTGVADFDREFRIRGHLSDTAHAGLRRPEVQRALRSLSATAGRRGTLEIDGGRLRMEVMEKVETASRLRQLMAQLVDAVEVIDEAGEPNDEPDGIEEKGERVLFPEVTEVREKATAPGANDAPGAVGEAPAW